MNKLNVFPAFTTPLYLIFLSSLSIVDKVVLVADLDKKCLVKVTARSNNTSCLNYLAF